MEISQLNEEKKVYEELKSLLYTGTISQYGKRKLIDIFDKQQKEIENLKEINKEHQKLNGELEEENTRQHELLGNIHQNYRDKITKIQEQDKEIVDTQYISKDKIRERIKELEGQEDWYIENKSLDDLYGRIDELKELLEEE